MRGNPDQESFWLGYLSAFQRVEQTIEGTAADEFAEVHRTKIGDLPLQEWMNGRVAFTERDEATRTTRVYVVKR